MKWQNLYVPLGLLLLTMNSFGQDSSKDKTSVSVSISATVVDQIQLITLADIDVGTVIPSEDILRLDPRKDQGAGIIKVLGRQNSSIQISYSSQVEMVNLASNSILLVSYNIGGSVDNDQTASDVFSTNPVTVNLNGEGEYYLWIGCSFSMKNLVPGQYDGDFILEVDYN
ncbi:MAG: hypothetical protein K9M55_09010 [Candidatus Marinimicrobia bacterium]|nr:hypothetical protein [Candidatus Neomarinimicrobiota bacterium]MCF7922827.1 hypothetical protein [Candidatus Neomarinimicrobiota bacterium]